MLGNAEIIWNASDGFVYHYVYHTLASLDYGRVSATAHTVRFTSERNLSRAAKRFFEIEYVKVKFGEKHLLVPKTKLADFALIAVGLDVQYDISDTVEDHYFWEKVDDEKKKIAHVPIYPQPYEHLIRTPIVANVLAIGKLRINREKSKMWGTTSEEHWRLLTLSRGSRSGIKVGMRFWIDSLRESVEIVSVDPRRSVAKLSRASFDGKEYCSDYEDSELDEFPCRTPKIGMPARTKTQYF
jgi:hypothetical protein